MQTNKKQHNQVSIKEQFALIPWKEFFGSLRNLHEYYRKRNLHEYYRIYKIWGRDIKYFSVSKRLRGSS